MCVLMRRTSRHTVTHTCHHCIVWQWVERCSVHSTHPD